MKLHPVQILAGNEGQGATLIDVWRHWLTMDDGRIYFQDERIVWKNGHATSTRSAWELLPTPPMTWNVVGLVDHGGLPVAMLANGEAFIYGQTLGEVAAPSWHPFTDQPVPKSHAYPNFDAPPTGEVS